MLRGPESLRTLRPGNYHVEYPRTRLGPDCGRPHLQNRSHMIKIASSNFMNLPLFQQGLSIKLHLGTDLTWIQSVENYMEREHTVTWLRDIRNTKLNRSCCEPVLLVIITSPQVQRVSCTCTTHAFVLNVYIPAFCALVSVSISHVVVLHVRSFVTTTRVTLAGTTAFQAHGNEQNYVLCRKQLEDGSQRYYSDPICHSEKRRDCERQAGT